MITAVLKPSSKVKAAITMLLGTILLLGPGAVSARSQEQPIAEGIRQGEGDVSVFWDQFDWDDLTCAEQALWGVLGWERASWQGEAQYPASEFETWKNLAEREQAAAVLLGYGEELWDADPEGFWNEFDWEEFPLKTQALWKVLGWSEASWQGEADAPASEDKAWNELTEEERTVAEQLGYSEEIWDG